MDLLGVFLNIFCLWDLFGRSRRSLRQCCQDLLLMHRNRMRIQLAALIIANSYFLSSVLKYIPLPILNCHACPLASGACPLGTIQRFIIIMAMPFYTVGLLGAIGSIFGGMTCGWICPFGFFQDILYKIKTRKINIIRN